MSKPEVHYGALAGCLALGLALWFIPTPAGLSIEGWHLLGIFITTIVAVIAKPAPIGTVSLIALTVAILTKTLSTKQAFAGFSDEVVWLVVFALFIAKGFSVTGLGHRIAYLFMRALGKRTLTLSYGLIATDLVMAPAIVSVTGRMGGIIYPIIQGIADSYHSHPFTASARKIGAFLTVTSFQGTVVTCAMFMTAMAANPVIAKLTQQQGFELTWMMWAKGAIVPGLISLICIPLIIYKLYPPEIKETPQATEIAHQKLTEMGKVSRKEWIMIGTLGLLLVLWIFGSNPIINVNAVTAAMIGIGILLITGVLHWKNLVKLDTVWETFFWFAILLMLAGNLGTLGVSEWISGGIKSSVEHFDWKIAFPILLLLYFYSHYLFASSTAHVAAMYVPFLLVAIGLGAPVYLSILCLMYISNLYGGLTHYSLAPAPVMYGSGYVNIKDWWKIGFIISIVNIIIWSTIGLGWWKILGYW